MVTAVETGMGVAEKVERQRRLVEQIRRATGLDPTTFAANAGVSPSTFSRIKRGSENAFSPRTLARLAEYVRQFGCTIDQDAITLLGPDGREIEVYSADVAIPQAVAPTAKAGSAPTAALPAVQPAAAPTRAVPRGELPISGYAVDGYVGDGGSPALMWVNPPMEGGGAPDTAACPPWLAGVDGVFVMRVNGRALEPVLLSGDTAYAVPVASDKRLTALRPGDVVVVQDAAQAIQRVGVVRLNKPESLSFSVMSGDTETVGADALDAVFRVVSVRRP